MIFEVNVFFDVIVIVVFGYEFEYMVIWFNFFEWMVFSGKVFVIVYDVFVWLVDYLKVRNVIVFMFDYDLKKKRYCYL